MIAGPELHRSNQIENAARELTRKQVRRRVHISTGQLENDIRAFIERHNENPRPYRWTKSPMRSSPP